MAGNIGDVQLNLTANTSQLERDVASALKRLESKGFNLGSGINARAFTQPLGRITGAANEFQKSLDASNARVIAFGASAGAIYNVQRAFTALIGSTIEVQKSLTDINVILNASSKTLGQFGDQLFDIAKNSGQAFSTVATAAGELARQGLTLEQTLKRTSDALILARLSGLDAASSVEALTASINSFNNSALDSTQIVNKLASVDAAFAVSSADLAEALKRVGSSAQDVGVSFDELLAIVASVNQTTARGGAVIGNSLKTIFTRVQRTDVLDQLQALGIAVRDLNGNTAPAIQILTGLAQKFDQLGDAQRSQVAELVGGVFQINVLKAALGDLSREYSIYGNALKISTGASNEAIRRNEELNKTLSALINRTVANLTKVGSEIGGLTLAPAIEKVLGSINFALEGFDVKGDGIGSKIGKGILEGIGSFISGPGLAILLGVFAKIFANLSKFVVDAARVTLGLNKESQVQAQIQERINNILAQNPQLVQNIVNKQISLLQVEKDILTVIQAQSQARQQSSAIAANLAKGLSARGVTVEQGMITTGRAKSQGFVPNFNANKEIMGAISGGYMPGQVRSMNIPNYGRVTYNTAEEVKRFPGLSQPGILPPEQSEAGKKYKEKFKNKYGVNPYANQGFIPNFVGRPTTKAQTDLMIKKGYVKASGNELQQYLKTREGSAEGKQLGVVEQYGSYWVPESKYNKLVFSSKANLERIAKDQGGRYARPYALVYPGFKETMAFETNGTPKGSKNPIGFYAVPFPGELKSKRNTMLGPGIYGNAINALVESSSKFLTGLAGVSPQVVKTAEFKRYLKSNISQDQIGSLVGNAFEGGILAALNIVPSDRTRVLDLTAKELTQLGKTFKIPYLANHAYTGGGDFKNSLSRENRNSMAEKIINSGMGKAFGFIPNFSPLERAINTENTLGGRGVLDYKDGIGFYVRDGKTQPNFAAVLRDHPEGIKSAIQNSKMMQGLTNSSAGFVPNFALPQSLMAKYFQYLGKTGSLTQAVRPTVAAGSLGTGASQANITILQKSIDKITSAFDKGSIDVQKATQLISNRVQTFSGASGKGLDKIEKSITDTLSRREGSAGKGFVGSSFARARDLNDRFKNSGFGKFSEGLQNRALIASIGAPIIAQTVKNLAGEQSTTGRVLGAGASAIGDVASFAATGSLFGPIGTAVGATVGVLTAGIKTYDAFFDKTNELTKGFESARENLNQMTSAIQNINSATEALDKYAQGDFGGVTDPVTRANLQQKAENQFAEGLAKLDEETRKKFLQARTEGRTADAQAYLGQALERAQKQAAERQSLLSLYELRKSGVFKTAQREGIEGAAARMRIQQEIQPITQGLNVQQLQEILAANNKDQIEAILKTAIPGNTEDFYKGFADLLVTNKASLNEQIQIKQKIEEQKQLLAQQLKEGKAQPITTLEGLRARYTTGVAQKSNLDLTGGVNFGQGGIFEELQKQRQEAITNPVIQNLTALGVEFNDSAKAAELMNRFHEEAAKIGGEYNRGLISLTEASGKLKLKFDEIMLKENAGTMFSKEIADQNMSIRREKIRYGMSGGLDPFGSFMDAFGDNAKTTADKINMSFANLAENMQTGFEDAFGAFVDGTKTAEDAFRDFALNISQQIIKEQFSIGLRGLLGGLTGGGGYGGTSESGSGGLLGSLFKGVFGGGFAKGGRVRKYATGGYVDGGSGIRDDVPALLQDGEYVLRKSAVNKYGLGMLNTLNRGGRVRGYAAGGSVRNLYANTYDYYGAQGELLTSPYLPEAFNRTITSPEELGNVPALSGRLNIADILSSRAAVNEENPMVALRNERALGMLNYQQQVSNFKTGYNEQMRQVEEARKQAQAEADRINSERMAAYNRQRTGTLIGGLLSAGLSAFSGLSSLGGGMQGLFGGGGGGGGFGNTLFGGIEKISNSFLNAFMAGGQSGGTIGGFSKDQEKMITERIESAQTSGLLSRQDMFNRYPQFGQQTFGYPGASFSPVSTTGGFMYNVGLGAPAGLQTTYQSNQDFYRVLSASPTPPVGSSAVTRGLMTVDQQRMAALQYYSNPNINPFGFAKGGLVKGYQIGNRVRGAGLSQAVINSIMRSEGKMGIQSGRQEYFGFRSGTRQFREIQMVAQRFGLDSPVTRDLVGQLLTERATKAGALNFSDAGVQAAVMSMAHMRGEGGAQAILNSVAGLPIQKSAKLTQSTIDKINMMDPLVFQSALKQKRLAYDKAIYGDRMDSVVVRGQTKTGRWWDLFGKGLTRRYEMEQELFSGLSVPEFKNFAQNVQTSTQVAGNQGPSMGNMAAIAGLGMFGMSKTGLGGGYYGPMTNVMRKIPAGSNLGRAAAPTTAVAGPGGGVFSSLYQRFGINQPITPAAQAPRASGIAAGLSRLEPRQLVNPAEAANILNYARSGALQPQPSLLSRSLSSLKNAGAGAARLLGSARGLVGADLLLNPSVAGPTPGSGIGYEIEMGYRDATTGQLTPLGRRVLNEGSRPYGGPLMIADPRSPTGDAIGFRIYSPADLGLSTGKQGNDFYASVGASLSRGQKGLERFAPFFGPKNNDYFRFGNTASAFTGKSTYGEYGFKNYLSYLGYGGSNYGLGLPNRGLYTPNALSPYSFASRYFSGFGGFGSFGIPFASSNYFGTGSRLGIQPNWVARATGGPIYGGSSYKDDVPAMLMGGEYVIRKDVVDRMGEPFFNRLNRGQISGFAEGGPVGTGLPSIGTGVGGNQQDNSKTQFVEALSKLLKGLEQLNRTVEEQTREMKDKAETEVSRTEGESAGGGVTNNININVSVDQNGQTTENSKQESQDQGGDDMSDQEKFKKTLERSRVLAELLRQQILKVLVEEQRPGGVLYQGSKGRDLGR